MYGLMFDIHVSKQIKIQQSISNILLMIIRFRDSAILNEIGVIHPIAIEMIYTFFAATFFIRKYKKYPALGRLLKLLGLFCPKRKKNYYYWILIRFLWNLSLFFIE